MTVETETQPRRYKLHIDYEGPGLTDHDRAVEREHFEKVVDLAREGLSLAAKYVRSQRAGVRTLQHGMRQVVRAQVGQLHQGGKQAAAHLLQLVGYLNHALAFVDGSSLATDEAGKRAFEAYNAGGSDPEFVNKNFAGDPCPAWEDLPLNVREKWQSAAFYAFTRGWCEANAAAIEYAKRLEAAQPDDCECETPTDE